MSQRLLFTDASRRQLREAIDSIRRADPSAARGFCEELEALARDPRRLEERGTPIPEFPELPFREARIGGHRVFFRRERETVWVTGVWHTRREPPA